MTVSRIAASLIALGLFAGPSLAAMATQPAIVLAQAKLVPPAVQMLLDDTRPASALGNKELEQRIRRATRMSQLPQLPDDVVQKLQSIAGEAQAELANRQSGQGQGNPPPKAETPPPAPKAETPPPKAETPPPKAETPPPAAAVPPQVTAYLADGHPASELTVNALRARIATGQQLSSLSTLPPDLLQQINQRVAQDRATLKKRLANQNNGGAADAPQVTGPTATQIESVIRYLNNTRNPSALATDDLKAKIARAGDLLAIKNLPMNYRQTITDTRTSLQKELAARQAAGTGTNTNPPPANNNPPPANNNPPPTNQGGDLMTQVGSYVQATRNPAAMSVADLKSAIATGDSLLARPELPPFAMTKITANQKVLRDTLAQKQAANNNPPPQPPANPDMAAAQAFLKDASNLTRLPQDRLVADLALAESLMVSPNLDGQTVQKIREARRAMRDELERRKTAEGSGNNQPPAVNQADEAQARAILGDNRDARTMDVRELRQRLNAIRSLLQQNEISPQSNARLRAKLDIERIILRDRMAQAMNGGPGGGMQPGPWPGRPGGWHSGPITDRDYEWARGDRRPPRDLNDDELRFRINIFVNILGNNVYPDERYDWQRRLDMDRAILRERMMEERARREAALRNERDRVILDQQRAQWDDIAAAEASDRELQDTLAAKPRRQIDRRVTLNDLENDADLRAALPRIEIDTIHFGFNEAFVREEEVSNLDRVAQVMEKILASNPNEVFLIEGHTDAAGSDAYNLGLSRQRAEAVKQALSTYYVIPERNLRTVGYGERFLKIPVDGQEPENRRVSVSRITDVVSQN